MGRASNRKKAQRQAGQKPQADAATQQALLTLAAGLQALSDENDKRDKGVAAASRACAADFRNSPLSITGIPQGTSGAEGLG